MKWFVILFATVMVLLVLLTSCKNSTEPSIPLPDTTSHNFTWKVEYLGDGASSTLFDVAILNDSLAYAVGALYFRDSLGNWDPHAYNLARWNGNSWELLRLEFHTICGQPGFTPYPTRAILAFSPTEVWIAMDGDQVVRWNGELQLTAECLPLSFVPLTMWGTSTRSVYLAGNGGNILYYNGSTWQKVESGITLSIQDIWGGVNPKIGETEILAVASDPYTSYDRKILKITATTVTQLSDAGIDRALSGVWFMPGSGYFASGGGGLWEKNSLSDAQWQRPLEGSGLTVQYLDAVRGNGMNDIVATGANGDLMHFNGKTWRNFRDQTGLSYGEYYSIAIKGDVAMAVGEDLGRGVVAVGKRVP
jgi:hypothetical protein